MCEGYKSFYFSLFTTTLCFFLSIENNKKKKTPNQVFSCLLLFDLVFQPPTTTNLSRIYQVEGCKTVSTIDPFTFKNTLGCNMLLYKLHTHTLKTYFYDLNPLYMLLVYLGSC
ncbi:hypothetical protein HanHA300_Chr04g0125861 [Helianthus annuus]|nr:hypothetical protein HanHA300_Chr04g0125861 [Helianthus annuus]KAJ0596074.1 hypothetical protein HanHA89_Chr04g0138661 [Helianthus annuus]KAJ0756724.1 hypothetical protein HanLR1_Chr04g0130401 [Helianthus annuus]